MEILSIGFRVDITNRESEIRTFLCLASILLACGKLCINCLTSCHKRCRLTEENCTLNPFLRHIYTLTVTAMANEGYCVDTND